MLAIIIVLYVLGAVSTNRLFIAQEGEPFYVSDILLCFVATVLWPLFIFLMMLVTIVKVFFSN